MKKRLIALCLALAFVLAALPGNLVSLAAEELADLKIGSSADNAPGTKHPDIGKTVKFKSQFPILWTDPTTTVSQVSGAYASKLPPLMVIVDVQKFGTSTILYQLDAADGYTWPAGYPKEDFTGKYWVESTKVEFVAPKNTVVDADGKAVSSVQMGKYEKPVLTASSPFKGENVYYQWQIEYAAGKWVNIHGATRKSVTLSYGMVANLLDAAGKVNVRAMSMSGKDVAYSDAIAVQVTNSAAVASAYSMANPSVANNGVMAAAEGDGEGNTTIYNVVIEYVFKDGSQAANPWTATIEADGDFSGTIKSPAVVGYTPDQERVVIDIQDIAEDKIYTVYYNPANVGFIVEHQVQNAYNDEYSVHSRVEKPGYTDNAVGEGLALTAEKMDELGVYDLPYDVEMKIAADGSTVVIIKYDRKYFLMKFDLSGGYGVEPIYARVGTDLAPETPIRAGYSFAGWDPAVPEKMPAEDTVITAKWTPGNTTYIVAYWAENANDDGYSFWGYKQLDAVSGTTVSGSDDFNGTTEQPKAGFHFDHADTNVVVKGDGSTTVNVYYKRNTYTLTFAYDGGPLVCNVHVHSNSCYNLTCGYNFEHKHSHEECCTRTDYYHSSWDCNKNKCPYNGQDHTHSTRCRSGNPICGLTGVSNHTHSVANGCYGMKFEGVKYGQDTSKYWAQAPVMKWKVSSSYWDDTFYTAAPAMPNSNLTIYGTTQSGSSTIHYYEYKNGQTTTIKVRDDYTIGTSGWSFTQEDYIEIPGFTYRTSDKNSAGTQYYIYYTRNSYTLSFKNGSELIDKGKHLYEADISGVVDGDDRLKNPTYTGDDPEGYVFAGWYTTEQCIEGTEWTPTGATMPYNNLILYAKWVPVKHEVKLYITKEDMAANKQYLNTIQVDHNGTVQEPALPDNGDYEFVAWFYMEDGVEKGYDFSIPVTKDMQLYAKWYADELADYTIKYAIKDGDKLIYIADDTKGKAVAGYDKTFEAKAGEDLYEDYRTGYYPETNSHSFTILLGENNTYTFIYVAKEKVKYTVQYLEKGTGNVLHSQKEDFTSEAIHTENFVYVSGYRPDAYQKRLVLSANESENVITFWYEKDTQHAPVLVKHYLQNPDGESYNKTNPYLTTTDLDGVINSAYLVDIIKNLEGFEFAKAEASHEVDGSQIKDSVTVSGDKVSANVTQYGLVIELYYDRIEYPYEFKFVLQGTDTDLHTPIKGEAIFGSQVQQEALAIPGYKCNVPAYAMTIQIEDGASAVKNVRIFYYVEETASITYVPVGSGKTEPGSQLNIPVISGTVGGSTATPDNGYQFVGWYKDNACTVPVDASWVNGNKITPAKTKNYGGQMGYESDTYYAKFEEIKVEIKYEVDGPTGCGTVTPGSEIVGVVTGNPSSTAAASSNVYKFVGWYDKDGNQLSTDATYNPAKNADGLHVAATYYAKFEYNLTSLTINKVTTDKAGNVVDYKDLDKNQTFIFNVSGNGVDLDVTVHGNGSVTIDGLTVGATYTITEKTDWSWRYDYKSVAMTNATLVENVTNGATIELGLDGTITFTNERGNEQWLDGDSWCDNQFN